MSDKEKTLNALAGWLDRTKDNLGLPSRKALADRCGLSESVFSYLYNGKRKPTAGQVEALASGAGIMPGSPEYLELLQLTHAVALAVEQTELSKSA